MSNKVKFLSRRSRQRLLEELANAKEGSEEAKNLREKLGAHAPPENPKLETSNSEKIEELKEKAPEIVEKKPVVLEEPSFVTKAPKIKTQKAKPASTRAKKTKSTPTTARTRKVKSKTSSSKK